jgi:SNF2 family DNA or RNA helicase
MSEVQIKVYENIIRAHTARKSQIVGDENYANLESLGKMKKKNSVPSLDTIGVESVASLSLPLSDESTPNEAEDEFVRDLNPNEARNIFTALRKAANHPLLLRIKYVDDAALTLIASTALSMGHFGKHCDKLPRIREEIEKMSDFDIHRICLMYPIYLGHLVLDATSLYDSPKMAFLQQVLPQLRAEGRRMLIFSQWTMILDLLEVFLQSLEYKYLRLDGSTPIRDRQVMIDEFSTPPPEGKLHPIAVFLLSTKAGGLGINLTAGTV